MRLRLSLLFLVFLVLLHDHWATAQRRNNNQRTRNAVNGVQRRSQVQPRIAGGTSTGTTGNAGVRRNRAQARIANGSGNGNRLNNRRARRARRARRNRLNRSNRNRNLNTSANRVNGNQVSSRIIGGVEPKIVGGQTASIASIPSLVQVHRSTNLCGGILIRRRWVLTAAHCARGVAASSMYIIGGTPTQNGTDGVLRTVDRIFIAPGFNRRTYNRDAALLKLNATMTGTNIATARLAQRRPRPGTRVRIGGWGATREGGSSVTTLRTVWLRVVGQTRCQNAYAQSADITRAMFCAAAPNRDSCSGDSGGGVYTSNGRVVGIVSFGNGCARQNMPGVYANTAIFRNWIRNVTTNY